MPPCLEIVQGVKYELEAAKPSDIELGVFDIGMVGNNLDVRVELLRRFLRNLDARSCQ
jgi:hypothetical protein